MANNCKYNVTRAAAIANVLQFFEDNDVTFEDDTILVLKRMSETLGAKRATSKGESEAHRQNRRILRDAYEIIANTGETGITSREFANTVPNFPINSSGVPSVNKAAQILMLGVREGFVPDEEITGEGFKLVIIPQPKKSLPVRYAIAQE